MRVYSNLGTDQTNFLSRYEWESGWETESEIALRLQDRVLENSYAILSYLSALLCSVLFC